MLRIRNIMTADVTTVSPETSVRDAMELLTRLHISGAPVVSGQTVLGVVSTSDLVAFAAALPALPAIQTTVPDDVEWDASPSTAELDEMDISETGFFSEMWEDAGSDVAEQIAAAERQASNDLEQHTVRELMSTDLITLTSDTMVKEAAEVLRRNRIHRVLVVDDGKLVGILSTLDIANAVADNKLTTREYVFNHDAEFAGDR